MRREKGSMESECTRPHTQIPADPQRPGRGWVTRGCEIFRHQFKLVMGRTDGSGQFMGMKEGGEWGSGDQTAVGRSSSDSFAFAVEKKRELSEGERRPPSLQLSVEIMTTRAMKGVTTFKVPLHSQKIASFPSFLSAFILGARFLSKPGSAPNAMREPYISVTSESASRQVDHSNGRSGRAGGLFLVASSDTLTTALLLSGRGRTSAHHLIRKLGYHWFNILKLPGTWSWA